MTLVAANVTSMLGPSAQLGAVLLVLIFGSRHLKLDPRPLGWMLLAFVAFGLAWAFATHGTHHAVIKAGKLALFCLASLISVRGANLESGFPAWIALRAFFGLCIINFTYAAAIGGPVFRAAHFIEFSIYSSYTIGILVHLARPRLTWFDRGAALAFCLLCGSTTGLMLLMLADLVGRRLRTRTVVAVILLAPIGLAILHFLFEAREKELTLSYLLQSDRGVLISTFVATTLPYFTASNWFFGLGAGQALHRFITPDAGFNGYLQRLGEDGIYAFCLHNEALRILCDFGLIGLLLIILRLRANCSGSVLFLLAVCMMTNSYLYAFSGALVASSIFNPKPKRRPSARDPHPANATASPTAYA
jgi:hypothetical protein